MSSKSVDKAALAAAKAAQKQTKAAKALEEARRAQSQEALVALRADSDDEPDPSATAEAAPKKKRGQVELTCKACGRSSSDAQFLTNSMGVPVSAGDVLCLASAKRLMPACSFEEYCAKISADSAFAKAAETAREALAATAESTNVLPTFVPAALCAEESLYGHMIYSKAGLLSETEIVKLTGKSPKDLGLVPFSSEWQSPSSCINFFPISLVGLSPEMLATIRRVKLYHSTAIRSDKLWLTPELQLAKNQGKDVLQHLHNRYVDAKAGKRPTGLVNQSTSSDSLQSLEDLKELAQMLDNQRSELLLQDAAGQPALQDLTPQGPVVQSAQLLSGLEEEAGAAAKKRSKKKTAQKEEPQQKQMKALVDDSASVSATTASTKRALVDVTATPSGPASSVTGKSDKTEASSKRAKMMEEQAASLDSEMRSVAELHGSLQDGRHKSFKSLQHLTASRFLQEDTDHNKGHAIVNAKKIAESLEASHPYSDPLQLLQRRIRVCSNLQSICEKDAQAIASWAEFDVVVLAVRDYWVEFPVQLKIKLTLGVSIRRMLKLSEFDLDSMEDKKNQIKAFQSHLSTLFDGFLVHLGDEKFDASEPSHSALCVQAFSKLAVHVEAMQSGQAAVESDEISTATNECQTILEAIAESTIKIWQDSSFRIIFSNPGKFTKHLCLMAQSFLGSLDSAEKALSNLQQQDSESLVQPACFKGLSDALKRVENIMKFIASSLMTTQDKEAFLQETGIGLSIQDTLSLIGYTGKQQLEKGLAEIVQSNPFWKRVVDEIVKTADSSLRLQPELERTTSTLKSLSNGEIDLTLQRLQDLTSVFGQLLKGMRMCDVDAINKLFLEQLLRATLDLVDGTNTHGTTLFVEALVKALKLCAWAPGVSTKIEELQKWMTQNVKDMALNDLVLLAKSSDEVRLALDTIQDVFGKLGKVTLLPGSDHQVACQKLLNVALRALINEVKDDIDMKKGGVTPNQLLKKSGLINMICTMAYPVGDSTVKTDQAVCVQHHAALLKFGVSLTNALANLESLGSSVEDRVRKDKQKNKVTVALQSYSQFMQEVQTFEAWMKDCDSLNAAEGALASNPDDETSQHIRDLFLGVQSKEAFEKALQGEMIFDTLSTHLVTHQEALHCHVLKFENALRSVTGENIWKSGLTLEDPIETVLDTGASSLLKMEVKGVALKSWLDDFAKELEVSKQFADHIMDSLKAVAKNPSESDSGFEGSVKHFLGKHRESVAMYKVGAIVYVEYICVLSLRQSQDPARVDKSRTLVCDTLAFLNNIDSELSSEVQPVLLDHAKKLLG